MASITICSDVGVGHLLYSSVSFKKEGILIFLLTLSPTQDRPSQAIFKVSKFKHIIIYLRANKTRNTDCQQQMFYTHIMFSVLNMGHTLSCRQQEDNLHCASALETEGRCPPLTQDKEVQSQSGAPECPHMLWKCALIPG